MVEHVVEVAPLRRVDGVQVGQRVELELRIVSQLAAVFRLEQVGRSPADGTGGDARRPFLLALVPGPQLPGREAVDAVRRPVVEVVGGARGHCQNGDVAVVLRGGQERPRSVPGERVGRARAGVLGVRATTTHLVAPRRDRRAQREPLWRGRSHRAAEVDQRRPVTSGVARRVDGAVLEGGGDRGVGQVATVVHPVEPLRQDQVDLQRIGQGERRVQHEPADEAFVFGLVGARHLDARDLVGGDDIVREQHRRLPRLVEGVLNVLKIVDRRVFDLELLDVVITLPQAEQLVLVLLVADVFVVAPRRVGGEQAASPVGHFDRAAQADLVALPLEVVDRVGLRHFARRARLRHRGDDDHGGHDNDGHEHPEQRDRVAWQHHEVHHVRRHDHVGAPLRPHQRLAIHQADRRVRELTEAGVGGLEPRADGGPAGVLVAPGVLEGLKRVVNLDDVRHGVGRTLRCSCPSCAR